jgi:hypothetical protein
MTDKVIFLLSGSSWTVPSDWNNAANTIEMIDGGGSGFRDGDLKCVRRRRRRLSQICQRQPDQGRERHLCDRRGRPISDRLVARRLHVAPTIASGGRRRLHRSRRAGAAAAMAATPAGAAAWTSTHNASGGVSVATAGAGAGGGPGIAGGLRRRRRRGLQRWRGSGGGRGRPDRRHLYAGAAGHRDLVVDRSPRHASPPPA